MIRWWLIEERDGMIARKGDQSAVMDQGLQQEEAGTYIGMT